MDFWNLNFEVWRIANLGDVPVEMVGRFSSLEYAKDFCEYQATLGNRFMIKHEGVELWEW